MSTASDPDVLLRAVHSSVLQLPSEQCDSWLEIYQCSEDELVDSTRRALVKRSAMWTPEHREVIVVAIQDFLRNSVNAVSAWLAIRRVDERVFVSILSQSVRPALYLLPSGEDRPKAALDASDALLRGGGKYVDQDRCEAARLKSWNAATDICYGHRSQLLGPHAVFKVAEDVVRRPRSNTTRQKKLVRDARAAVVAYAAYYAAIEFEATMHRWDRTPDLDAMKHIELAGIFGMDRDGRKSELCVACAESIEKAIGEAEASYAEERRWIEFLREKKDQSRT